MIHPLIIEQAIERSYPPTLGISHPEDEPT